MPALAFLARKQATMLEIATSSLLNGVLYAMLLFMTASGLTLIFSMTGVLNFAHASFYMLGAYLGFGISRHLGFWPGLVVSPLVTGGLGALVQRFGLRRVHERGHSAEMLFTFGLAVVISEAVQMMWGRLPVDYRVPPVLDFVAFSVFGLNYPAYRMFMLVVALLTFLFLLLLLSKTRIGLVVQASLTHPDTVAMLGHNVPLMFTIMFGIGCGLAGLAGAIAGPILVTEPDMAVTLGSLLFVIVVVGGLGSLVGAFVASLLIGLLQTFSASIDVSLGGLLGDAAKHLPADISRLTVAQIAPLTPYLLLVLILIFRPRGLMGTR
jgi:branched-chain amino acid transport system permease protein